MIFLMFLTSHRCRQWQSSNVRAAGISKCLVANATNIKKLNFEFKKPHSFNTIVIITVYMHVIGNKKTLTVYYRVSCAYKYSAHLNFTMIFGKKNFYFIFSRIISQELIFCKFIHHRSHLKPFLSYLPGFHVQCSGNISASFSM